MKRTLLYCLLPLMLFACKKSEKQVNPPPSGGKKTYEAHFNVSANIQGNITTHSLSADAAPVTNPVQDVANKLFYYVYDSSGQLITQLVQDSTATNFGLITDTFDPGTYNIVIVAYKITAQSQFLVPNAPTTYSTADFNVQGCDAFFKTFSLTVTNETVTQNINLDRIVGQLQVKITDPIPSGVTFIEVDVTSEYSLAFATGLADANVYTRKLSIPVPAAAIGTSNFIITTYLANTTTPFTVTLSSNKATGVYTTVAAPNVTCALNTRTLLSGDLFTNVTGQNAFTVTFDNSWDNNPVTIQF